MEVNQLVIFIIGTGGSILLSVAGFLAIRALSMIDHNLAKLTERLDESLSEAFTRLRSFELDLQGLKIEHKINHKNRDNQ